MSDNNKHPSLDPVLILKESIDFAWSNRFYTIIYEFSIFFWGQIDIL